MRTSRSAFLLAALALLGPLVPAVLAGTSDAEKLLAEGKTAAAAEAFAQVLKGSPSDRPALLGFAKAVTEGTLYDHYQRATVYLTDALKARPEDREVRLALGRLFLARSLEDDRFRADVQDQFGRLAKADPADEEAAVGLARMYYLGSDYARGLQTLDDLLAKKPNAPLALYWKGVLLYDEATQTFGRTQSMDEPVQGLFQRALEALSASTKLDGARFDAWMKRGYAAQYLLRASPALREVAVESYLHALDLDAESDLPMRGLSAVYANDAAAYAALLERLAKERPKAPVVQYYRGFLLKSQGKGEEAEKAYRAFAAGAKHPALGWFEVGEILRERGDAEGARKAYVASLEADPTHRRFQAAVDQLMAPLLEQARDAVGDAGKAKALVAKMAQVAALAPKSFGARNDLAFFAREAYDTTKRADRALLDACVANYLAASELIGEFQPDYLTSVPYKDRHAYAQVLNDTGLMFQYYPAVEDLAKAEAYYLRALEWTEHGYWDAYTNLMKVLEGQGRTQEAFDLATACAEGIKTEEGEPQETFRATCRGRAEALGRALEQGGESGK